jgi:protein arginine N-methyltransferase 1
MIGYYVSLLGYRRRIESFRRAIGEVVRPGDVVAEVGAGLGTFSFFAARRGAARVYAIERGPVHRLAAALARDNEVQDVVEVIGRPADRVVLPRRADVLITEEFSRLFLDGRLDEVLIAPRRRLLRRGGRVIPRRIRVFFAAVARSGSIVRLGLSTRQDPGHGLRWRRLGEMALNTSYGVSLEPSQLLSPPRLHTELETSTLETDRFTGALSLPIRRSGTLAGLAGWFEAELSRSARLSNAPGVRGSPWGQALLPVAPIAVRRGDQLAVRIALLRDPWGNAFWRWEGALRRAGTVAARFEHNTLRSLYFTRDVLRTSFRDYVLPRTPRLQADRLALALMGTGASVAAVAGRLRGAFPREFPSERDALRHACELAERYA